jgi:hypothetical protein
MLTATGRRPTFPPAVTNYSVVRDAIISAATFGECAMTPNSADFEEFQLAVTVSLHKHWRRQQRKHRIRQPA